jgi:hypothetical protein
MALRTISTLGSAPARACRVVYLALVALGCTGQVSAPATSGGAPNASGTGNGATNNGGDTGSGGTAGAAAGSAGAGAPPLAEREWPSAGLRRLNVNEYRATVRDLLGLDALLSHTFQADTPIDGFTSIGATTVAYAAQQIEQFEEAAYDATRQVWADTARRSALVGCEPASSEDACIRAFLSSFARRAFRRAATVAELDAYTNLVTSVAAESDVWSGLAYAVAAILQSPSLLYRSELGEPDGGALDRRRLTAFEVATRLSYLVTGSTPDDQLLAAAESGVLDSAEGLRGQLERLLQSEYAEATLMRYLEEQLEINHVSQVVKVQETFPTFSPALAEAMQREMHDAIRDVAIRRPGDLLSLLSRRDTYVNGPLAALYGLSGPTSADDWRAVTLPEDGPRAGLLGFAGFLALHAGPAETSVTKRGLFVVSKLLCRSVLPPPDDLVAQLPEPLPGAVLTMRQRVEQHMSDPACSGCHREMDPPGLALEHFDALGAYRETDHGLAIDATGDIDGLRFDGAVELGRMLASHPEVSACFARRFYEFTFGTQVDTVAQVADFVNAFEQSGRLLPELVRSVVTHDVFRFVSAPR